MRVSEAQSRAIAHGKGPAMVLAGPGSGKTLVITNRTKYLIEHYGVRPEEILVITFTKAAAAEMKERFGRLMGPKNSRVTFGTFHGVFFQILKYAYHYSAANILKEEQKYRFLEEIADGVKLEYEDQKEFLSDLAAEISLVKNEQIPLEHYYSSNCSEEVFRTIFQSYQDRLRCSNLLDFDDMLVYCFELLRERKDILAQWRRHFRYILVDEFQDINQLQYEIIRLLAAPEDNLFIVGDDDQSIYRFRGAKPEIMLNFQKDYPKAEVVLLDENYRSVLSVLEASGKVIQGNLKRFQKKIKGLQGMGEPVDIREFANQEQEGIYLLKCIRDGLERGNRYSDMAILTRTNVGGRYIAEKLLEFNLPFCMRDAVPNLYDHWIARDIFTYIRIASGSRERKDFLQIINRPKRYISRECLDTPQVSFDRLCTFYEDKNWMAERIDRLEADLNMLKNMRPYAAINYIRHGINYEEYLEEYAKYRHMKPEELLEVLNELQESSRSFSTYQEWFAHIEEYRITLEEQLRQGKREENALTLSTLHSAKGLEFTEVFILDINEEIIPHRKALLEADLEEERRLFYVGMTRAKNKLHLFYLKERYGKKMEASRFLTPLIKNEKVTRRKLCH
ncbi:MAG: ATP-dependent helicase [Lachnospiraceae bacterium]|nr:ATP-dependent helicase [Lachnospiraceae bacterium]